MRTTTTQEDNVIASKHRSVYVRVYIDSNGSGSFVNATALAGRDWLHSIDYGEDVDSPGQDAIVRLWREQFALSLSPGVTGNRLSSYVAIGRAIYIETATVPMHSEPVSGDWREVFRGQIDEIHWQKNPMELRCRDQHGTVMDTFIESQATYGGGGAGVDDLEDVIQEILDDNMGGSAPTLYVPSASSWTLSEYVQMKQPTMEAIRVLAQQIGWDVRYKWHEGTTAFRLTLFEPDRSNTTPDYTIPEDGYFEPTQVAISRAGIRNAVRVTYGSGADRTTYTATDGTSISKYGRLFCEIVEDAASNIDSATEAQAFAEAIRDDLKEPNVDLSVPLPYNYALELGDLLRFPANDYHFSANQDLAIVSIRHSLTDKQQHTTVSLRGAPSGGFTRWLEMESRRGLAPPPDVLNPNAPSNTAVQASTGSIIISYDEPTHIDWALTEVYVDVSSIADPGAGNRPSSSLLAASGRQTRFEITGLVPGTTYYARLIVVDTSGNVSSIGSQVSTATTYVGPNDVHPKNPEKNLIENGEFTIWTPSTSAQREAEPPDRWTTGHYSGGQIVIADLWNKGVAPDIDYTATNKSGDYALTLGTANGAYTAPGVVYAELVPVVGDRLYEIKAIVGYSLLSQPDLEAYIDYFDASESFISSDYQTQLVPNIGTYTDWPPVSLFTTAPATARFARVLLGAKKIGALDTTVTLDKVEFRMTGDHFWAYHNAATTYSTGNTIVFGTEIYDWGGLYATGTGIATVRVSGEYDVEAVLSPLLTAGNVGRATIAINGTSAVFGPVVTATAALTTHCPVSVRRLQLVSGDTLRIKIDHNEGSGIQLVTGQYRSSFQARMLTRL